jgi:hypothetical protein
MEVYNSVYCYECETCGAKLEIVPLASIGVIITVGLLVLGFCCYIFFRGDSIELIWHTEQLSLAFYCFAVIAWLSVTVVPLSKHLRNPVVRTAPSTNALPIPNDQHMARRPILWLEKMGLVAGLLAPFLLIATVLGVATLIGYVNYTYF